MLPGLVYSIVVPWMINSSYGGCFVDEYQDCTLQQHEVIRRLANHLPTCIFGDPLQAIFDFRGQAPVSWEKDVFPIFGQAAELVTPWRWKNAENEELAEWLRAVRVTLQKGENLDLGNRPNCVTWTALPADPRHQQAAVVRQCLESMRDDLLGKLIVVGDSTNENRRSALAKKLAQQGFVTIEAVGCKTLFAAAKAIDGSVGQARFKMLLAFAAKCMTGADKAELQRAVDARQQGRRLGQAKFGDLLQLTEAVIQDGGDAAMLTFLHALRDRPGVRIYRREMYFAMQSALQTTTNTQPPSLHASIWEVQNRSRHAGRRLGTRSIGSTLLVKGLEFDRAIVTSTNAMSGKDWYVALTRATKTIRIISPSARFTPAA
ncbi:hypothetical protein ACVWYH_005139 [Bradyrhizobium sp. GM24.11]